MTLRARLGIAAGVAVALAVVAVAVSAYAGMRSNLQQQIDSSLSGIAQPILARAAAPPGVFNPGQGGPAVPPAPRHGPGSGRSSAPGQGSSAGQGAGGPPTNDPDEGLGLDTQGAPAFGGPAGITTLVYASGDTYTPSNDQYAIPADARARAVARTGRGRYFTDMTVRRTHIRVLVQGIGPKGALMVALPLTDLDRTLHDQLLILLGIAAAGVALAALLGLLVARTALAPIARFTRQAEAIAAAPERLDQRVRADGHDELSRLGRTFNTTLDALERSVQAQRNLVADASHELRTPISSLRANLQLLRDEDRLPQADRDALREDMIEELDELTGLVGDVVDLARGTKQGGAEGDVRLDEVVAREVERTRRRAPALAVTSKLEPALVRGDGDRITRAVANVLDNARKWSPAEGQVEVALRAGTLRVRDQGPGFREDDLPYVFDRFHRAADARSKPGSGLGLAIVRQAAEAHRGFAKAENAQGGGAIVTVNFGPALTVGDEDGAHQELVRDGLQSPR